LQEAIQYVERYDYEYKILEFITKEFSPSLENKKGDDGIIKDEEANEVDDDDVSIAV
jgi:hypothetical protein